MTARKQSEFPGFSRDLLAFLRELARHNEKKWFDAHRADYDALYLEPAKAFAAAMAGALKKIAPDIRSEPRVNGSIMRIHRDTRFSKDKTPYKTALHFIFAGGAGPLKRNPAFYVRIAADELGIAAGLFGFEPTQLARYRRAVVDPKLGRSLRAAVDRVRKAGPYELSEPDYERVPRGLDADHPNAEFLRHRGLFARAELPIPAALFRRDAVPYVTTRFQELRPIQAWLAKALDA